jgi:hypothetical protein
MFQLESPQNYIIMYDLHLCNSNNECTRGNVTKTDWKGMEISRKVKLATDSESIEEVLLLPRVID